MPGIKPNALLLKELYGSKSGALSWEVWCDTTWSNLLVMKNAAKGVYMKDENGVITRNLRHSDNFFLSGTLPDRIHAEYEKMASKIRLTEPEKLKRLLGCTFIRINTETGKEVPKRNHCSGPTSGKYSGNEH